VVYLVTGLSISGEKSILRRDYIVIMIIICHVPVAVERVIIIPIPGGGGCQEVINSKIITV